MEKRCTWTGMAEAENHYTAKTPTLGIGLCEYLYSLSTLLVALVGVWPAPGFTDTEIRCHDGTGGVSWIAGDIRGSSRLRR